MHPTAHAASQADACADERTACMGDTDCEACMDGASGEDECSDTADPTTCSGAAADYCCFVGEIEGCSNNALLIEFLSECYYKWVG